VAQPDSLEEGTDDVKRGIVVIRSVVVPLSAGMSAKIASSSRPPCVEQQRLRRVVDASASVCKIT
jgi:hypothetical protein